MSKSNKYQLKKDKYLNYKGQHISHANITDKIAKGLLKENPQRISLFSVFPNDWNKSEVEPTEVEPKKADKKAK